MKRFSAEFRKQRLEEFDLGMSVKEIAIKNCFSQDTLRAWIRARSTNETDTRQDSRQQGLGDLGLPSDHYPPSQVNPAPVAAQAPMAQSSEVRFLRQEVTRLKGIIKSLIDPILG